MPSPKGEPGRCTARELKQPGSGLAGKNYQSIERSPRSSSRKKTSAPESCWSSLGSPAKKRTCEEFR